jgi:hypothetical protein
VWSGASSKSVGRGASTSTGGPQLPVLSAASWVAFLAAPAVFLAPVPVALADDLAVEAAYLAWVAVVLARVVVFLASAFRSWVAC